MPWATLALMYQHLTGPEDRQVTLDEFERTLAEASRALEPASRVVQNAREVAVQERGTAE